MFYSIPLFSLRAPEMSQMQSRMFNCACTQEMEEWGCSMTVEFNTLQSGCLKENNHPCAQWLFARMYSSDYNQEGAELSSDKEFKLVPISISVMNKTAAPPRKALLRAPFCCSYVGSSHKCLPKVHSDSLV